MEFRTSILVLFIAIAALPAELMVYFVVVKEAAASGDLWATARIALNFVFLMAITAAIGLLAPLSVLIEVIIKKAFA
jgi:hypothetical protein